MTIGNSTPEQQRREAAQQALRDGKSWAEVEAAWNGITPEPTIPIGTRVRYWPGHRDGRMLRGETRTDVWKINGYPVVSITGYAGGISLENVEVTGPPRRPDQCHAIKAAEDPMAEDLHCTRKVGHQEAHEGVQRVPWDQCGERHPVDPRYRCILLEGHAIDHEEAAGAAWPRMWTGQTLEQAQQARQAWEAAGLPYRVAADQQADGPRDEHGRIDPPWEADEVARLHPDGGIEWAPGSIAPDGFKFTDSERAWVDHHFPAANETPNPAPYFDGKSTGRNWAGEPAPVPAAEHASAGNVTTWASEPHHKYGHVEIVPCSTLASIGQDIRQAWRWLTAGKGRRE